MTPGRTTATVLVALLVTAASCTNTFEVQAPTGAQSSTTARDEGTPVTGGTLRIGSEAGVVTLDPSHGIAQTIDREVALALYDPLVRHSRDPQRAGEVEPWLVTKWSMSPDSTRLTLTVREGVTFSDGTPFDATSIRRDYEWKKSLGSRCNCDISEITSLSAPDPTTVIITLSAPRPRYIEQLTRAEWFPVSPKVLDAGGDPNRSPVGTGPFVLSDRDTVVLRRNDHYWRRDDSGRQLPYLDEVRIIPLPDSNQRLTALANGDVDLVETADAATIAAARNDTAVETQLTISNSSTISMSNVKRSPFDDPRMRRVTQMALDREAINDQLYGGNARPAYWLFPKTSPWHDSAARYPGYDPAAARKLLAEIVADRGDSIRKFTISCIKSPSTDPVLQLVAQQYRAIGLEPTLDLVDQATFVANILSKSGNYQGACFRSADAVDPSGHGISVRSGAPGNYTFYSNPRVDRLLDEAAAEPDDATRHELLDEFQEILAKDGPFTPLIYGQWANIARPAVNGIPSTEVDVLGLIRLDVVWLAH